LERGGRAVCYESITIMLEHNGRRIEGSGFWRSDGVVNQRAVTSKRDIQLELTAGGLTENAGIKFQDITASDHGSEALGQGGALGIMANTEGGGVGPIGGTFRDRVNVNCPAYGPVCDGAVRRMRREFKTAIK